MKIIQTYFECFRAGGMDTVFQIWRMEGQRKLEARSYEHCNYDGISAMADLSRSFPEEGFRAPSLKVKPKPSFLKQCLELAKWYAKFYPFMPSLWKSHDLSPSDATGIVLIEEGPFSLPDASSNTLLLLALDRTSREYLEKPLAPTVWMTPVGLYEEIDRNLEPVNRVSFIDLKIRKGTTPNELQAQFSKHLRELHYWGTYLTFYGPRIFGIRLMTLFTKNMHHIFRRTGTFSNVGEWTIPGLPEKEWWVFGRGVVARMSPVMAMATTVNGKLGLMIHFHSSVGLSPEAAQEFAEKWKATYLTLRQS